MHGSGHPNLQPMVYMGKLVQTLEAQRGGEGDDLAMVFQAAKGRSSSTESSDLLQSEVGQPLLS
jgi:hypothetical protein